MVSIQQTLFNYNTFTIEQQVANNVISSSQPSIAFLSAFAIIKLISAFTPSVKSTSSHTYISTFQPNNMPLQQGQHDRYRISLHHHLIDHIQNTANVRCRLRGFDRIPQVLDDNLRHDLLSITLSMHTIVIFSKSARSIDSFWKIM